MIYSLKKTKTEEEEEIMTTQSCLYTWLIPCGRGIRPVTNGDLRSMAEVTSILILFSFVYFFFDPKSQLRTTHLY